MTTNGRRPMKYIDLSEYRSEYREPGLVSISA